MLDPKPKVSSWRDTYNIWRVSQVISDCLCVLSSVITQVRRWFGQTTSHLQTCQLKQFVKWPISTHSTQVESQIASNPQTNKFCSITRVFLRESEWLRLCEEILQKKTLASAQSEWLSERLLYIDNPHTTCWFDFNTLGENIRQGLTVNTSHFDQTILIPCPVFSSSL